MFGNKRSRPQSRLDSLIGAKTRVEGDIRFSGGLRVDGQVQGDVVATGDEPGTLVLSDQARIEGEIRVSHVVINGTVVGPVYAGEYLELQSKARVTGDIHYKTLEIQLGAVVEGRLVYQNGEVSDKVLAFKPATGD